MISSIRFKLLSYITVNILLFAGLLYLANTFFAEKYYIEYQKKTLMHIAEKVINVIAAKQYKEDFNDESMAYEITRIERNIGCTVTIGNSEGILYYPLNQSESSFGKPGANSFIPYNSEGRPQKKRPDFREFKNGHDLITRNKENAFFITVEDPKLKLNTLRYQLQLDNGLLLQIWLPMEGITESAAISNNFTAFIAMILVLFTGIFALIISGKFTRPIKQINRIAKKMSGLDFSETIHVTGKDEIAQLSHSINNLSSELSKAIGQLNSKNRQLEEDIDKERKLDKMRREFVSSVSHELKTPIFLIQGYAEGLKSNVAKDKAKQDFYCDVIMEEAEKMNILVRDLLELSQIQSGMFKINRVAYDITAQIHEIMEKYKPVFMQKGIKINVSTEEQLFVDADPIRIEQVIVNYLNNAVSNVDERQVIKVCAVKSSGKARISVYNSGVGIPEDSLEKIWLSFYKVDEARSRMLGGTGLGLSIVKAIMEAHGSGYGVVNMEEGVEFWFELSMPESELEK